MKHGRKKLIHRFIVFIIILSIFQQTKIKMVFSTSETQSSSKTMESIDLNFQQNVGLAEIHFQRIITLSKEWDNLLLNLTVQNYGETLDSVFISTSMNGIIAEASFETYDRNQLKKRLAYQFELRQSLIFPLNYSFEETQTIIVSVLLDSTISWRSPHFNFSILAAKICCLEFNSFESPLQVKHFPEIHSFLIRTTSTSFLSSKILINILIPVEIPLNQEFMATIKLKINGAKFDVISVDNGKNYFSDDTEVEIKAVMRKDGTINNIGYLKISLLPSFISNDEYTLISISSEIQGVFQDVVRIEIDDLQHHPIPSLIMLPILVISFFCIPYYYVYKEETENKGDKVIDGKGREI